MKFRGNCVLLLVLCQFFTDVSGIAQGRKHGDEGGSVRGAVNLPIGSIAAARLVGYYHHLPGFITAPGETDVLMIVVGFVLIGAVLGVGNLYLHLHTLPERMAHKSQKLQFEIVAVLGLLALIFFWKTSLPIRILLAATFLFVVGTDVMTFAYFYPRNDIMFNSDLSHNLNSIEKALKQWGMMNWTRSLIATIALVCSMIALHKYYRL